MTTTEIIQTIHETARRPETHLRPRDWQAAKKREQAWDSLTNDEKRTALEFAEGELSLLDVALEDIAESRREAARS